MIKLHQSNLTNKWIFKKEILEEISLIKNETVEDLPWWSTINYEKLLKDTEDIFSKIDKNLTTLLVLWIWW